MAIFDGGLPIVSRLRNDNPKQINLKQGLALTKERWKEESGTEFFSIEIQMRFVKCKKKFLGVCTQREYYSQWVDVPYNIYTPNFYPTYSPINVVYENSLDEEFELDIPKITTEEEWEKFSKHVKENNIQILKKVKKENN